MRGSAAVETKQHQLVSTPSGDFRHASSSKVCACGALTFGDDAADAQRVTGPQQHSALPALLSLGLLLLLGLDGVVQRGLLGDVDVELRLVVRHHAAV